MSTLQLQLFGSFQISYAGAPVAGVNQARLQALLAYFVLQRNVLQEQGSAAVTHPCLLKNCKISRTIVQ